MQADTLSPSQPSVGIADTPPPSLPFVGTAAMQADTPSASPNLPSPPFVGTADTPSASPTPPCPPSAGRAAMQAHTPAKRRRVEQKEYQLWVRSAGPLKKAESLLVRLSVPSEQEECVIGMALISEFRLDFAPSESCVLPAHPRHVKASLECGHSFSALALLYHFAKNSMTCPCCRAGHAATLDDACLPPHLRPLFQAHLAKERAKDEAEQTAENVRAIAHLLEEQVNSDLDGFMRQNTTRVVLTVYSYETRDSICPAFTQEVSLFFVQMADGIITFSSSGFEMRDFTRVLDALAIDVDAFEFVVGARSLFGRVLSLYRTRRVVLSELEPRAHAWGGTPVVVPGVDPVDGVTLQLGLLWGSPLPVVGGILWEVPRQMFTQLLVLGAQQDAA